MWESGQKHRKLLEGMPLVLESSGQSTTSPWAMADFGANSRQPQKTIFF